MTIFYQALGTALGSILCMTLGIMYTWPSITMRLFSSANTTLDRPMTDTEISLLSSCSFISGMISLPLYGYFLDNFGRKSTCMMLSLMQVTAWVIIITCYKVEAILASVFISGLSSGMLIAVPIYVGEFCQESVRGMMSSASITFYGVGMMLSYLFGGILKYDMNNYVSLTITVIGIALVTLLKESPLYLIKKGLEKEAKRSIAFYRGLKINSKEVAEEIESLRRSLNPELDDATPEEEKLNSELRPKTKLSFWQFMKKSRSSRRALLMTLILYTLSIFQGLAVIQVYAERLFSEAVPNMSSTLCSVLNALVCIISGIITAYLIDLLGRRPLIIYASLGSGICCLILGSQIQLHWGPHWVTALLIYLYAFIYNMGPGTVPYVIIAEVFLPEIKSLVSMIVMEWAYICFFVMLFIFNPVVSFFGLGPVFYIFGVICFLTSIYSWFFVPETMGLTVDVIQTKFVTKRENKLRLHEHLRHIS